jgi:serine/threonine protein phosphatase PrpC
LTDLATDEDILKVALKEKDPHRLCQKLIDLALERGAHDNTTVVTVFLGEIEKGRETSLGALGGLVGNALNGVNRIKKRFRV